MSFFTTSRRSELDSAHFDTIAFAYDAIGIPIAAGVLYPAFGILLSPIIGALAMSLSSVSVIANALRLRSLSSDSALKPMERYERWTMWNSSIGRWRRAQRGKP